MDGGEGCGSECTDLLYTACTCGTSDPCGWLGDGYCDLLPANASCALFETHFDDTVDCVDVDAGVVDSGLGDSSLADAASLDVEVVDVDAGIPPGTPETIDDVAGVDEHHALAIDDQGMAHVVYWDGTDYALKYAVQGATGWQVQTVDDSNVANPAPAIGLAADGTPWVSYLGGSPTELRLACPDNQGSWTKTPIARAGYHGHHAMKVATGDVIHLAYSRTLPFGSEVLCYAQGPAFVEEVVASASVVHFALALDANQAAHLVYYDEDAAKLKLAERGASDWSSQVVLNNADTLSEVQLISSVSDFFIAYFDGVNSRSLLYSFDGQDMHHIKTFASAYHLQMGQRPTGQWVVTYDTAAQNNDYSIVLAEQQGEQWVTQVMAQGGTTRNPRLGFLPNGKAGLTYYVSEPVYFAGQLWWVVEQ